MQMTLKKLYHGQMIFHKGVRELTRENSFFNKQHWDNCLSTCKRMHLDSSHDTQKLTQNDRDLNVRVKTIKLFEENRVNRIEIE